MKARAEKYVIYSISFSFFSFFLSLHRSNNYLVKKNLTRVMFNRVTFAFVESFWITPSRYRITPLLSTSQVEFWLDKCLQSSANYAIIIKREICLLLIFLAAFCSHSPSFHSFS